MPLSVPVDQESSGCLPGSSNEVLVPQVIESPRPVIDAGGPTTSGYGEAKELESTSAVAAVKHERLIMGGLMLRGAEEDRNRGVAGAAFRGRSRSAGMMADERRDAAHLPRLREHD